MVIELRVLGLRGSSLLPCEFAEGEFAEGLPPSSIRSPLVVIWVRLWRVGLLSILVVVLLLVYGPLNSLSWNPVVSMCWMVLLMIVLSIRLLVMVRGSCENVGLNTYTLTLSLVLIVWVVVLARLWVKRRALSEWMVPVLDMMNLLKLNVLCSMLASS